MKKEKITWNNWWDGEGVISAQWLVYAFPTTYVIDPAGVIRYKDLRGAELEKAVERLLEEFEVPKG
jgi:hypothetical protein